jgi:Zn-dependent protease
MTAALTPARALAYLGELSVDVRAAVVLDPAGEPLVGARTLAASARELLLARADAPVASDGAVLVGRAADGGAIAVLAGDFALIPLLKEDLGHVARRLVTTRSGVSGT